MRFALLACALWMTGWAQEPAAVRGGTTQDPLATGKESPSPGRVGSNPAQANPSPASAYDAKGVDLSAQLLNAAHNARNGAAEVKVTLKGLRLVDPDRAGAQARPGEGHLNSRVDMGPVVSTTATELAFRQLPHGHHEILVEAAANDETPLGPHAVLKVDVP